LPALTFIIRFFPNTVGLRRSSAILAGEKVSGVSIIQMTNKVDAGDIYAKKNTH